MAKKIRLKKIGNLPRKMVMNAADTNKKTLLWWSGM